VTDVSSRSEFLALAREFFALARYARLMKLLSRNPLDDVGTILERNVLHDSDNRMNDKGSN
jgi:hypothetical protein